VEGAGPQGEVLFALKGQQERGAIRSTASPQSKMAGARANDNHEGSSRRLLSLCSAG
jgi:hypothetical protein